MEFVTHSLQVPHIGSSGDVTLSAVCSQVSFGESMGLKTDVKLAWEGELPLQEASCLSEALGSAVFRVVLECHGGEPQAAQEEVRILIDPIGDLASYFEIGVSSSGGHLGAVLRRTRVGLKKNVTWRCSDLNAQSAPFEDGHSGWIASLAIPFVSLIQDLHEPPDTWQINFKRSSPCAGGSEFTQRLHFAKLHFAGLTSTPDSDLF